ncbi:MAG: hypothetical protein LBJ72_07895 [Dysgonamonadaceae bacterium]|jgi:hypothetical protein|nr:hypothetical protein [Dysgonamonadaceae bacterium]
MSSQKYRIGVVIDFFHDYFMNKQCHLILQPATGETNALLARLGILIRKQNYSWILLMPEKKDVESASEEIILEFEVICRDELFYYYTIQRNIGNGKNWTIEYVGLNGIYSRLKILLNENLRSDKSYHIPVNFESQHKYWEFILIPKFTDFSTKIRLSEDKNRIQFNPPEVIDFPEKQSAYQIVTTNKIKLMEKYDYKLRLWEMMHNGEKTLNNSIQYPKPQSISTISAKDTITSYIYY